MMESDGPALLAGPVACGQYGKKMTVRYQRGPGGKLHPVYVCSRGKSDYAAAQCQQLAGPCVDAHVTGLLLAAMAPAALEVSLTAAGQAQAQREQVDRIWRQRLERADFAAGRRRSLREFGPGSGQDHRDRGQRHGPPTGQPGLDVDADLHRFLAEHAALAVSGCSSRPRVLEREGERDLT